MKTYAFELDGQKYKLKGLTLEVKEEFCDPIRAKLIGRAQRMLDKKQITPLDAQTLKTEANELDFHSKAVVKELSAPNGEGWKKLFGVMLLPVDAGTPEFLDKLWVEQKNPNSSFAQAITLVHTDAYPTAPDIHDASHDDEDDDPKA